VTDETGPEPGASEADERDDAPDDWFRPKRANSAQTPKDDNGRTEVLRLPFPGPSAVKPTPAESGPAVSNEPDAAARPDEEPAEHDGPDEEPAEHDGPDEEPAVHDGPDEPDGPNTDSAAQQESQAASGPATESAPQQEPTAAASPDSDTQALAESPRPANPDNEPTRVVRIPGDVPRSAQKPEPEPEPEPEPVADPEKTAPASPTRDLGAWKPEPAQDSAPAGPNTPDDSPDPESGDEPEPGRQPVAPSAWKPGPAPGSDPDPAATTTTSTAADETAGAQTQMIPRIGLFRPSTSQSGTAAGTMHSAESPGDSTVWTSAAQPQPQTQEYAQPGTPSATAPLPQRPAAWQQQPPGRPSTATRGGRDDGFDDHQYVYEPEDGPRRRGRRGLLVTAGVGAVVAGLASALLLTGTVKLPGVSAKPVPTVGFSPSGSDAGSNATQTGTAFLTAWQNGDLRAAANITDSPATALAGLTGYRTDLKLSGLTLLPGTATTAGWMPFNVTAQVGAPASPWSYSSGLATYSKSIDGYTRWFVKWQPAVMFAKLTGSQRLGIGAVPASANRVVDRNGTEITAASAPSLTGIVKALKQSAPPSDGTPGQKVQIEAADGTALSTVAKVSDPVNTGAVKTTLDLNVQKAAQAAVSAKPDSSMVVVQPSTGAILAVANNPPGGLDNAMVGRYAPGSTFKTITTTLVLDKGVITNLNQTWDCPAVLNADGIALHNSEQEAGVGKPFLWDFAQSCNNAFSRFEGKVSRDELVATAHDYFGFNQKWDVGLGQPTTYGYVPDGSANSLAEELVGQDQIGASPLVMASVAATVANGSFRQPILVPGAPQIPATPLPDATRTDLKTLMRSVVTDGTLAVVFNGQSGVYGKTGTAEVGKATPNSWTIAFKGDVAVGALVLHGGFGASSAGPEIKSLLNAIS
jgi:hypothetical protein